MTRLRALGLLAGLLMTSCGSTAPQDCNASTCQGCCTAEGKCEAGNTSSACGSIGAMCRDCAGLGLTCTLGTCSTLTGSGGGSGNGGGTGGGATGGGMGGGVTGGGAGGGATGGGTGGGGASGACAINNGGCAAEAICTAQGATRICTCDTGYVGDGFTCSDVNECASGNGGCSVNATCTNIIGSRTCTCMSGYSGDGVSCSDVDECATANGGCSVNATCTNTIGSRSCACLTGYTGDGVTCSDVNECLTSNGGCSVNATCTNQPGSRTCTCLPGYTGNGLTCTASVATWTIELVSTLGGSSSSIALDGSGNPAIAYTSDSPRGVHFRRRLGASSWSSAEYVDTSTNGMQPSMLFSNGFVIANSVSNVSSSSVASWRRSTTSATWSAQGSVSGPEQPDVALGGGREHLVANTRIAGMPSTVLYAGRAAGLSTWSAPITISTTASWGQAKIAASSSGQLAIVYTRSTDSTLWLAQSSGTGASWTSTQVTTGRVWAADVVIDGSGLISIGYYTPDSHLIRYEAWSGGSRVSQTTVDSPGGSGLGSQWFSGVAITRDTAGHVHLSYLDFTRGTVLRYATNRTGSWVAETVTTSDDVLGGTSIVTDATNAPHISFPSPASSFGNLGYAVKR